MLTIVFSWLVFWQHTLSYAHILMFQVVGGGGNKLFMRTKDFVIWIESIGKYHTWQWNTFCGFILQWKQLLTFSYLIIYNIYLLLWKENSHSGLQRRRRISLSLLGRDWVQWKNTCFACRKSQIQFLILPDRSCKDPSETPVGDQWWQYWVRETNGPTSHIDSCLCSLSSGMYTTSMPANHTHPITYKRITTLKAVTLISLAGLVCAYFCSRLMEDGQSQREWRMVGRHHGKEQGKECMKNRKDGGATYSKIFYFKSYLLFWSHFSFPFEVLPICLSIKAINIWYIL